MTKRLERIHGAEITRRLLARIEEILVGLYGPELGVTNYGYLEHALSVFVDGLSDQEVEGSAHFDPSSPYAHLDGKVFAIAYPDNVYDDTTPTLKTLGEVLERYFPSVNGIHILPERPMSHGDLWPQDLLGVLSPKAAGELVGYLRKKGVLDGRRNVGDTYANLRQLLRESELSIWYQQHADEIVVEQPVFTETVFRLLDAAFDSHFNDGGFSQISRAIVDPRFGTTDDLRTLSGRFAIMLDFVVNHLDVDNDVLQAYRRGQDDGSAFIIVTPERYEQLKTDRTLEKTFRPRPFPLFTGMRKHAAGGLDEQITSMNDRIRAATLHPLDNRLVAFLSIIYKVRNDQGLTAADRRIFTAFEAWAKERGVGTESLFAESRIQPQQSVFLGRVARNTASLLTALGIDEAYARVFDANEDQVFGQRFYVYTTFSESQSDLNPTTEAGFKMIVDDLFHLLAGGELAMMRLDAIKYLWKEIGKANFDMEEGNRLIEVIRLLLRLAAPQVLPLDEINSPDPVVYEMTRSGGFAYLFGQVNSVPAAFNAGTLQPIERFTQTRGEMRPDNLVLFVMLATHDGRSVQGLGVQRTDGHVTIEQFQNLKDVVEARGGKPKVRSVARGEIPRDTFEKISREASIDTAEVRALFVEEGETLRLRDENTDRERLLQTLASATARRPDELAKVPAIDYFLDWIIDGQTVYELCCTSRSAFSTTDGWGHKLTPQTEAARLALAQLYVLTQGQDVPAIYFNDLLGLANDIESFEVTGRPRDLNRRKSYLPQSGLESPSDPFLIAYLPLINAMLAARVSDRAFYPGSPAFEYRSLTDTVFLNHAYARDQHAIILGNIVNKAQEVELDLTGLAEIGPKPANTEFRDALESTVLRAGKEGRLRLTLPPYGAVWLNPQPAGPRSPADPR